MRTRLIVGASRQLVKGVTLGRTSSPYKSQKERSAQDYRWSAGSCLSSYIPFVCDILLK